MSYLFLFVTSNKINNSIFRSFLVDSINLEISSKKVTGQLNKPFTAGDELVLTTLR